MTVIFPRNSATFKLSFFPRWFKVYLTETLVDILHCKNDTLQQCKMKSFARKHTGREFLYKKKK